MFELAVDNTNNYIAPELEESLFNYLQTAGLRKFGVRPADQDQIIRMALLKASRMNVGGSGQLDGLGELGYWTAIIGAVSGLLSGAQQAEAKRKERKARDKQSKLLAQRQAAAAAERKKLAMLAIEKDRQVIAGRKRMAFMIGIPILLFGGFFFLRKKK